MSMESIRKAYDVPAKRGGRVIYQEGKMKPLHGVITSTLGGRLRVRVSGIKHPIILHPTSGVTYLEKSQP